MNRRRRRGTIGSGEVSADGARAGDMLQVARSAETVRAPAAVDRLPILRFLSLPSEPFLISHRPEGH